MALAPFVPWTTLKLLGEADKVKSPTGLTVKVIVAVLVKLPEVPVTVTVEVPIAAVAGCDRVKSWRLSRIRAEDGTDTVRQTRRGQTYIAAESIED